MEEEHTHTNSVTRYAGLSRVEAWIAYGHGDLPTSGYTRTGRARATVTSIQQHHAKIRKGEEEMRRGANRLYTTSCFPRGWNTFWFLFRAWAFGFDIVVRGTGFSHWVFSTGTICIRLVVALIILGSCFWFYIIILGFGLHCALRCYPALPYEEIALDLRFEYALRISFWTSEVWLRNRVPEQDRYIAKS
jgi:hypothetical protein